ncbi:MAG: ComEC/Rec2 family competence protein [Robiginitomaculum sp.]|nr:ComEC/Rec2 family competence protein [Robiginitomaculum sp.]
MANSKEAQPIGGFFGTDTAAASKSARRWHWGRVRPFWAGMIKSMVVAPTRGSFSLWAPWAFCAGAAAYFFPSHEPLWPVPVFVFLLCAIALIYLRRFTSSQFVWLGFVLALIAAFMAGWGVAQWRSYARAAPVLKGQSAVYRGKGRVVAVDKERGHRARYLIAPQTLGRLPPRQIPKYIRISSFRQDAEPGDRVRFTAALQAPAAASFPGGYNFIRDAWFKQIGGTGFSYGHLHLMPATEPASAAPLYLAKIRRGMALRIRENLGGQKGAVAAALVTGDRSAISEETADDLREAGLAHMLAISGLHMGLVAGLVFGGGAMVLAAIPAIGRRYDARKPAALLGLAVAIVYLLLSGASAPTQRAFVMTAVVLAAVLFDRRALSLRTISLAALIVIALSPENVISPGFQMSFAAALALIAFYEWVGMRGQILPKGGGTTPWQLVLRFLGILAALALTSLIAGLATGPFAAFYFHRTAVYGLIANMAAMPVFTFVVMPSLLTGTLLNPIGAGAPFFALAGWGLDVIMGIAHTVAHYPGALARINAAPALVLGPITIGLLLVCLMRERRRLWGLALILSGLGLWTQTSVPDGVVTSTGGALKVQIQGQESVIGFGDISQFELEQFATALAIAPERAVRLKKAKKQLPCDASGCSARLKDGRRVVFNRQLDHLAEDCRVADLVITTLRPTARNVANCPDGKLITGSRRAGVSPSALMGLI